MSKSSSLLADARSKLALLPLPPSSDPLVQLGNLIDGFTTDLRNYATGNVGFKRLIQDVNAKLDDFKLDIQATEPRFIPFEKLNERREDWVKNVVAISSSDKGRPAGPDGVASRKRRLEEVGKKVNKKGVPELVLELDIDDMQAHIKRTRTRELPESVPHDAKTDLIKQSLRSWTTIVDASLERVRPIVHKYVHELVAAHFARFDQGVLCSMVRSVMSDHLDALFSKCREHLDYFVSLEQTTTTRNTHLYSSTHENLVGIYNGARKDPPGEEVVRKMLAIAVEAGNKVSWEDIVRMLSGRECAEEIDVMASVQAYWKVAYKRIIDNIPRAIDADIVQRLHEDAQHLLTTNATSPPSLNMRTVFAAVSVALVATTSLVSGQNASSCPYHPLQSEEANSPSTTPAEQSAGITFGVGACQTVGVSIDTAALGLGGASTAAGGASSASGASASVGPVTTSQAATTAKTGTTSSSSSGTTATTKAAAPTQTKGASAASRIAQGAGGVLALAGTFLLGLL
ncbi:hypothetical protein RQP46_007205 [Phenoliferia psychrophenolica]